MQEEFLRHLGALGLVAGSRTLVAVSGGCDSVVLLDLLAAGRELHRLDLVVAHVDHGIHGESGAVAQSVEALAGGLGLRAVTGHLALGREASETRARESRYAWLEEIRGREGARYILTAHHADDQAETVLLRFLHGSGPAGLAAMAPERGCIIRPLLPFRRSELMRHARERGLRWWNDPANADPRHLRSWIRGEVLPALRNRLPDVDGAILQVGAQAQEDRAAWDRVIDVMPGLDWRQESAGGSVAVALLAGYDSTLGTALLRAVARRSGCRLSREHAGRAWAFLRSAGSGDRLDLGNGWSLEMVFDRARLIASRESSGPAVGDNLLLSGEAGDGEMGRWRLFWRYEKAPPVQQRDALTAWFIPRALEVRRWEAGDKVYPLGGRGRRLVVRCFQDARVPRHDRAAWPMVTDSGGEIVWVPGVCRSNRLVPPGGAEALRVDAQVV
jgi:tRNA(Ile)-lysidine synthase